MTIKDITKLPWFAHPKGGGVIHTSLPSFRFPLKDGRVPLGTSAAETILRVVDTHNELIPATSHIYFQELAQAFSDFAYDDYPAHRAPRMEGPAHSLAGVKGQSELYQAFVEFAGQPDPIPTTQLDGVRALILIYVSIPWFDLSDSAVIYKLASAIGNPLLERNLQAGSLVNKSLQSPRKNLDMMLPFALEAIAGPDRSYQAIVKMVHRAAGDTQSNTPIDQVTIPRPTTPGETLTKHKRPRRTRRKTGGTYIGLPTPPPTDLKPPPANEVPVEDIEDQEGLHIPDLLPPDEDPKQAIEDLPDVNKWQPQSVHDYFQARDTRLRIYGPLLPHTERVLSKFECQALMQRLETLLSNSPTSTSVIGTFFGTIGAALMLVTGRDRSVIAEAIGHWLGVSTDTRSLKISNNHWIGTSTIKLPDLAALDPSWFHDLTAEVQLPLPDVILRALDVLYEHCRNGVQDNLSANSIATAIQELREDIPRLTQARLRTTLPATINAITGHTRDWQLIVGDSGDRSTAALHYYAPTLRALQDTYHNALTELGIHITPPPNDTTHSDIRVGAPRAAIRLTKARSAVNALRLRTEAVSKLGTRPTVSDLIGAYNALAVYAAIQFVCCTTHRQTSRLATIRRGDILRVKTDSDVAHMAVIWDKGMREVNSTRVVALPDCTATQINVMLWYTQRLLDKAIFPGDTQWRSIRKALQNAINGKGPIWYFIDRDECLAQPLERAILAIQWPEWEISLPLLRQLGATRLCEYGATGGDIAQQMGHAIDTPPYDRADPESPLDFSLRLSPVLAAYLSDLGFSSVGTVIRRNQVVPQLPLTNMKSILRRASRDLKAYVSHRRLCRPRPTKKDKEQAFKIVDQWMTSMPPCGEWVIDPERLHTAFSMYLESSPTPTETVAVRDALVSSIHHRAKSTGKRRAAIPPVVPILLPFSEIRAVHFDAFRLVQKLEEAALAELTGIDFDKDFIRACETGRILLAIWGLGTSIERQQPLLSKTAKLLEIPGTSGLAYLAAPINMTSPDELAGQIVSMRAIPLVNRLLSLREKHELDIINSSDEVTECKSILEVLGTDKVTYTDLFELIALARQITASGQRAAWERGALDTVGLSPDRLSAAVHNKVIDRAGEISSENDSNSHTGKIMDERKPQEDYKELRLALYKAVEYSGNSKYRNKLKTIATTLTTHYSPLEFIGAAARDIMRSYEKPKSKPSRRSIYSYLTLLTSLITRYHGSLVSSIDPEILEDDLSIFLAQYTSSGRLTRRKHGSTARSAVGWVLKQFADHGCYIELPSINEEDVSPTHQRPGYLISAAETTALLHQVKEWNYTARNDPQYHGQGLNTSSALLALLLQTTGGFRLRELCGLRDVDLRVAQDHFMVSVTRRIKRTLKTNASNRLVHRVITPEISEQLDSLNNQLNKRRTDTQCELLATQYRETISSISSNYTEIRNNAAEPILGAIAGWTHIYRPTYATAVGLSLASDRCENIPLHLPNVLTNDSTWRLPKRVVYVYHARQLGHGSPVTTAVYYDHAPTLQTNSMRGWNGPSNELQAHILNISNAAWNKRSQRYNQSSGERLCWKEISPLYYQDDLNTLADETRPPHCKTMKVKAGEISLLAHVALRVREGLADDVLANELGLDTGLVNTYIEQLQQVESQISTGYLSPTINTRRTHSRRPKSHVLTSSFCEIDKLLNDNVISILNLQAFLRKIGFKGLLTLKPNDAGYKEIERAFTTTLSKHRQSYKGELLSETEKQLVTLTFVSYVLTTLDDK